MDDNVAKKQNKTPELATPLAFSAIGFATFLTVLNMNDRGPDAILATKLLAGSIPLFIVSVGILLKPDSHRKRGVAIAAIASSCSALGILAAIYYCFREVSATASTYFIISIVVALGVIIASGQPEKK